MYDSDSTTNGIRVNVRSSYLPERSDPPGGRWIFAYRIRISNVGREAVQLLSRHWIITDAHGSIEEVKGPGVVGEQPVLGPGEAFEYTSFCPLRTPFGTMHGTYQMVTSRGGRFEAVIPPFTLSEPLTVN